MLSSTTDSRVLPLVWRLLVLFLAFVPVGRAATAKCVSGWEWSNNSKKQSPCEVAGYLQGACLGYGVYELEPLAPDSWYTEPGKGDTRDLKCGCNTIIYSLYSACTACQNISTQAWTEWSQSCDAVYVTQYPFDIPGGTAVPQWAFIDVTKADSFNATAAEDVGRDPEALGKVPITLFLSSITSGSSLSTLPTSGLSSSASDSSFVTLESSSSAFNPLSTDGGSDSGGNTSDRNNDLPAIIGGVVGGVVGFAILSSLIWFFLRHHSREAPFYVARSSSYRTLSTRQSYYPPSVSVYSSEPEMDESGNQFSGIYSRLNPTSPRESMYSHGDPHSTISPAESDVQTTHFSTSYGNWGRHDERTEFR